MSLPKMSSLKAPKCLNRLQLPGTLWVASDIHLDAAMPRTATAFHEFLEQACGHAQALILCGDIFDVWIGDDHALRQPPEWLAQSLVALRKTARAIPLYLVRGNRDFLMGQVLANMLCAHMLHAPVRLDTDAGPVLLAHGDEYCTDDISYQRFRRLVHNRMFRCGFLSLPLGVRRSLAGWARQRSQMAHRRKPFAIMDVNPQAVGQAMAEAGCQLMVHGHTHRPASHELLVSGRPAWRHVLPDWDHDNGQAPRGGWISISADGISLHTWPDGSARPHRHHQKS